MTLFHAFYHRFPDDPGEYTGVLFKNKQQKRTNKVLGPEATAMGFPREGPHKLYFNKHSR